MASKELIIEHLFKALSTTFDRVTADFRHGTVSDLTGAWVDQLVGSTNGLRLSALPRIAPLQPVFPFVEVHRITAESYYVARGGMMGGPCIDVLIQIWLDTEEVVSAYGVPLVMHAVDPERPLPDLSWHDLTRTASEISALTFAGRMVFVARSGGFPTRRSRTYADPPLVILGVDVNSFSGQTRPMVLRAGRSMEELSQDIASGWIGDPALGGKVPSPLLDALLMKFDVRHILRLKIGRENGSEIFSPQPLPF
ncbi:MAG: hypothetical protein QM656_05655 [Paracoccaceae bacterium]